MTRSLPEWQGKTPDDVPPPRVRARVFLAHGGKYYRSGIVIRPGMTWALDHVIALVNGGKNVESNLAPILTEAHKEKTREDLAIKTKIARVRAKHLCVFPKSKTPLRSRPFAKTRALGPDQ